MVTRGFHLGLLAWAGAALGTVGCTESGNAPDTHALHSGPAELVVTPAAAAAETHERRKLQVALKSPGRSLELAQDALEVSATMDGRVAFVNEQGLHLVTSGERRRVGPSAARGLHANEHGVAYTVPAKSGGGSGVAIATWDGTTRVVMPAAEGLPGPAGYFKPLQSPDGRFVFAWSNLTPRPSIWRVDVTSDAAPMELAPDVPGAASEITWVDGRLAWTTADGQQARLHPVTGTLEVY